MGAAAAVLWVTAGFLVLLGVVGPKRLYWGAQAWQYKHPEANEPSDASYDVSRVVTWVLAGLMTVFAIGVSVSAGRDLTAAQVYDAASRIASEFGSLEGEGFLDPSVRGVADRLGYGAELRIEDVSSFDDADRYVLTNDEGDHPVCLAITADRGNPLDDDYLDEVTYDAEVTRGAC
jgi:hypothetical protein